MIDTDPSSKWQINIQQPVIAMLQILDIRRLHMCWATRHNHAGALPLELVDQKDSKPQEDHRQQHQHGRAAVSGAGIHQGCCGRTVRFRTVLNIPHMYAGSVMTRQLYTNPGLFEVFEMDGCILCNTSIQWEKKNFVKLCSLDILRDDGVFCTIYCWMQIIPWR